MKNRNLHCLFFLLMTFGHLHSQSPFKASVMAGINISQIDGDYQVGYDKRGVNIGLRGGFSVNKRIDIMSELFYHEIGTVATHKTSARGIDIDLKYAEIPITFNLHSKPNKAGFYNWTAHAGFSYGRLLKSNTFAGGRDTTFIQSLTQDSYSPHDWAVVWGLSYNFRPHFGIRFQQSFSLNKFYINPIPKLPYDPRFNDDSYRFFRNYFLSFQVYYDFFAPKVKRAKKK